jgi:hypothetical protein
MTTADKHPRTGRWRAANGPHRPPRDAAPLEENPAAIRTHNKPSKPRRRRVPETSANQQAIKQRFRRGAPSRPPQLTCRTVHNRIRCSNGHDRRRCRNSLCITARLVGLRSDAP